MQTATVSGGRIVVSTAGNFSGVHTDAAERCYNMNASLIVLKNMTELENVATFLDAVCFSGELPIANNIL